MIIWIFMILDLIVLGTITFSHFGFALPLFFFIYCFAYLSIKALLFRDLMSAIDFVAGVYILVAGIFHFTSFFYYFILGWFLYKLLFTLIG